MLDFIQELSTPHVRDFFLLFLRVSGVLSFFPFFENHLVPLSVRGALSLYVSAIFLPHFRVFKRRLHARRFYYCLFMRAVFRGVHVCLFANRFCELSVCH